MIQAQTDKSPHRYYNHKVEILCQFYHISIFLKAGQLLKEDLLSSLAQVVESEQDFVLFWMVVNVASSLKRNQVGLPIAKVKLNM